MRIGSLFSGYGGLDMAVASVFDAEVAWHVEYDKAPSRILAHHYPDISNYGDVTTLDFTTVEPVDILTGGYPCQPFSHAGKRKGTDDDRHLWPHVLRAIRQMGPSIAVLENVRGHLSLGFDIVLADLADLGWSARWGVVRASDAGAPHQRARLFIVAHAPDTGGEPVWKHTGEPPTKETGSHEGDGTKHRRRVRTAADASRERHGAWQDARGLGRLDSENASGPREWERTREVAGDRGSAAAADAPEHGRPERWSRSGERAGSGGQSASDFGTPADADVAGGQAWRDSRQDGERLRVEPLGFAPSTADAQLHGLDGDALRRGTSASQEERRVRESQGCDSQNWGDYAPAIARWERVIGRPAPAPTEPGRTGAPRLSPAFVEWMMGLPAGHVTDPVIGISRNDQLKALGNGVVPQQAALALSLLLPRVEAVAS